MTSNIDTMSDGPSPANEERPDTPAPHTYGLLGLFVSFVFILGATVLLCAAIAGLAFGIAGLAIGWQQAFDRFASLRDAAGSEAVFIQRLGIVVSLVVYGALVAAVLAVARFRAGARWRELIAWHAWQPLRGSRLFWIVTVATIAYSFGADVLISRLYPPSTDWVTLPAGRVWAILFVVLAVVFAPVAEEILFRGWLYTGLRAKIGIWAGILLTSALFAVAHWEKTHIYALAVFPVGVALGFIRERTGSLKASMTLHALYNATASVMLVLGS